MPGRVLVVDDIPSSRMLVRVKLNTAYFEVIEAESGLDALDIVANAAPDLVLLDVMMPGIDGFETCRRLKANPETVHIPVVLLTALDNRSDRKKGLAAGADDFVSKPFDDVALLSRVDNLTRMKMMIDELRKAQAETSAPADGSPDTAALATSPDMSAAQLLLIGGKPELMAEISAGIRRHIAAEIDIVAGEASTADALGQKRYDAFVIGPAPVDGTPMRIAAMLRARPSTRRAALMMMFAERDLAGPRDAMEMGISDYVSIPPDYSEMTARLRVQLKRKHVSDALRRLRGGGVASAAG